MKKITVIFLAMLSASAVANMTFNIKIPQPDMVSNDWDGDNIPNHLDDDDDNDTIKDVDDSSPFGGRPGFGESTVIADDSEGVVSNGLPVGNYTASSHHVNYPPIGAFDLCGMYNEVPGYLYNRTYGDVECTVDKGAWLSNKLNTNQWLQVKFEEKVSINKISLHISTNFNRLPNDFDLLGSDNGVDFTVIQSYLLEAPKEDNEFNLDQTANYQYYRLFIRSNGGNSYLEIDEWQFY